MWDPLVWQRLYPPSPCTMYTGLPNNVHWISMCVRDTRASMNNMKYWTSAQLAFFCPTQNIGDTADVKNVNFPIYLP